MVSSAAVVQYPRPRAVEAIALGGLVAGVLDGLDAVVFYGWVKGGTPTGIFQYIASGLIGPTAFQWGGATVLLGVAIHFLIATGAATAYYLLSLRSPALWQRPFLCGPLFGLGVFVFMHYLVVPLSAAPKQPPIHLDSFLNLMFSHVLFVGIPIALTTRHSARTR